MLRLRLWLAFRVQKRKLHAGVVHAGPWFHSRYQGMPEPRPRCRATLGFWVCCLLLAVGPLCRMPLCAAAASRDARPEHYRIVACVAGWSVPPVIHAEKLTHINF